MKYLLVVQIKNAVARHPRWISVIEEIVEETLSPHHLVDGHDIGSGEANLFIKTASPQQAFSKIRDAMEGHPLWPKVRIAYRDINGSAYTVLWPKDLHTFSVR